MTKDTKVISIRVPNRVEFSGYNAGKLITSLYDLVSLGALKVEDSEIIVSDDSDGEWVREIAHELNVDIKTFKRKIEVFHGVS